MDETKDTPKLEVIAGEAEKEPAQEVLTPQQAEARMAVEVEKIRLTQQELRCKEVHSRLMWEVLEKEIIESRVRMLEAVAKMS